MLRFQAVLNPPPPDQPARTQIVEALDRADEVLIAGRDRVRRLRAADTTETVAHLWLRWGWRLVVITCDLVDVSSLQPVSAGGSLLAASGRRGYT